MVKLLIYIIYKYMKVTQKSKLIGIARRLISADYREIETYR